MCCVKVQHVAPVHVHAVADSSSSVEHTGLWAVERGRKWKGAVGGNRGTAVAQQGLIAAEAYSIVDVHCGKKTGAACHCKAYE